MSPNGSNIAVFGTGYMAIQHMKAAKSVGYSISLICGGDDYTKTTKISGQFGAIPVQDSDEIVESINAGSTNLVIVAAPISASFAILEKLVSLGNVAILAEKPGATNSRDLATILRTWGNPNVMIAYNRRFYDSVVRLRETLETEKPISFNVEIGESVAFGPESVEQISSVLCSNTVHVFDFVRYILGEVKYFSFTCSSGVSDLRAGDAFAISARVLTKQGVPGNLSISFGLPVESKLRVLSASGRVLELKPFETLKSAHDMRILEPTDEYPMRQYSQQSSTISRATPKLVDESFIKPGVVEMWRSIRSSQLSGAPNSQIASLSNAIDALQDAERFSSHVRTHEGGASACNYDSRWPV